MIENHISVNLYNELFSESSEEKCMTFASVDWFTLFVSFISFFIKSRTLM